MRQKELISEQKLTPSEWLVERDTPTEMVLVNKETGRSRVIRKGA